MSAIWPGFVNGLLISDVVYWFTSWVIDIIRCLVSHAQPMGGCVHYGVRSSVADQNMHNILIGTDNERNALLVYVPTTSTRS